MTRQWDLGDEGADESIHRVRMLLRAQAASHRPESERILRRVRNGARAPEASWVRPRFPGYRAWVMPALATAGVIAVAGAGAAVFRPSFGPTATTGASATSAPASSTPTTRGTVRPPVVPPAPPAPKPRGSGSPSPTYSRTSAPPSSPSPPPNTTHVDPTLAVEAVAAGQRVALPGAGALGWLVAGVPGGTGAGPGPQVVRDTDGPQWLSGPHASGDPISAVEPGPFSVRWTGGQPAVARPASTSWLTARARAGGPTTGLAVNVVPGSPGRTLVLYAGADGATGRLEVVVGGRSVRRVPLRAGAGPAGYLITVDLRAIARPGEEVDLRLTAGTGGAVAVAAAVLR
jgi:hypothetical protein